MFMKFTSRRLFLHVKYYLNWTTWPFYVLKVASITFNALIALKWWSAFAINQNHHHHQNQNENHHHHHSSEWIGAATGFWRELTSCPSTPLPPILKLSTLPSSHLLPSQCFSVFSTSTLHLFGCRRWWLPCNLLHISSNMYLTPIQ